MKATPATVSAHPHLPNIVCCHVCHQSLVMPSHSGTCPRCGAVQHRRHPKSLSTAWAWVLTGFILYIPANLLPIMTVDAFPSNQADTILDGVRQLFASGMWGIGLLVFCASIAVPLLKLCGLAFLLLTLQLRPGLNLRQRTTLYRIIEFIGRWSMLDMFLLSILVTIVQLGQVATITPGLGAVAFGAVVVVTIFAATAFDPRLMWDKSNLKQTIQSNG